MSRYVIDNAGQQEVKYDNRKPVPFPVLGFAPKDAELTDGPFLIKGPDGNYIYDPSQIAARNAARQVRIDAAEAARQAAKDARNAERQTWRNENATQSVAALRKQVKALAAVVESITGISMDTDEV